MSANSYLDNIQKYLFLWIELIENSNSLNRNNKTIDAENLVCKLLNLIFGWKLINSNQNKTNQDSFDLNNAAKTLFVQVTSNKKHSQKLTKSIEGFKKGKYKPNSRFIIVFLTKKCSPSLLNKVKIGNFEYEGFDIPKLYSAIFFRRQSAKELKAIDELLQGEIMPISIDSESRGDVKTQEGRLPSQITKPKPKGLYIERTQLVKNIFQFGQDANGLLIGGPGMGKSFVLEELQRYCAVKKLPCYVIRINELIEGSDAEIKEAVGFATSHWIKELKSSFAREGKEKAFLLFDAFDTAKDERVKNFILLRIQKAIAELSADWAILVTSRTFDASKSFRLRQLFPTTDNKELLKCRSIEIPELSEGELFKTIASNPVIYSVFEKGTSELKRLLRIPYFLKLFESILSSNKRIDKRKVYAIETEQQLLEAYWNQKVITNSLSEIFLGNLTRLLAEKENLSCHKNAVVDYPNASVYEDLVSLGILEESRATRQNISFAHNILLEYAISVYVILEVPNELIEYVKGRPKMPFSFRQSFIYFYNRLWDKDKALYWQHYFLIKKMDDPVFRLFHQNILNFVLGALYTTVRDIEPVFSLPNIEERSFTIKRLLEGIRFIRRNVVNEQDLDLLLKASEEFSLNHLWELGSLINKAILQLQKNPNRSAWLKVTKASINYLTYIITERETSLKKWYVDGVGSTWGIPNICMVFNNKKNEAKKLIRQVLLILNEDDFLIPYFLQLARHILDIFQSDHEFGKQVYATLYFRTEVTDGETQLGTPILGLRSTRKQDFHMVHYKLEKDFSNIQNLHPETSFRLGIEIINHFASSEGKAYRRASVFPLVVNGVHTKMMSDFFYYDFDKEDDHGAYSCLEKMFHFLELEMGNGVYRKIEMLLDIVIKESVAARLWRRLLKFLSDFSAAFKQISYGILTNEAIFVCNETIYDAGELVQKVWNLFDEKQQISIETVVIGLQQSKLLSNDPELAERRIKRFLTCVPENKLHLPELQAFRALHGTGESNQPLMTRPRLQSYTPSEEEEIQRTGADPLSGEEMAAYKLIKKIEPFNAKFDNNNPNKPSKDEYEPLIPTAKELWEITKNQSSFNKNLLFSCDYEVSRFVKLISRNGAKLTKAIRGWAERIAFYYIQSDLYKMPSYETGNIKNRWGAFTPTPRTAATVTLLHLLNTDKLGLIAPVMIELFSDNIQIVRFEAIRSSAYLWHYHRDEFWRNLKTRIQQENDGMCLHDLIRSICYDNIMDVNRDEVEEIATLAFTNLSSFDDDPAVELWQTYVVVLLKLLIKQDSVVAKGIIYRNAIQKGFTRMLISEITNVVDPHNKENNYITYPEKYADLFAIVDFILNKCFETISEKGLENNESGESFQIIDYCIQQFYFAIEKGKKTNKGNPVREQDRQAFFLKIKPLLKLIVDKSTHIGAGFMVANTGYYFMQLLNGVLYMDPEFILDLSSDIVKCAAANNFTYDPSTTEEIVKLTEQLLADHKDVLSKERHFNSLIIILDQFANSGSQEALELTWRLREVF